MAFPKKLKKPLISLQSGLTTTLFFTVIFTIAALLLLRTPTTTTISTTSTKPFSGDLRKAEFSWNRLSFPIDAPPPIILKIAVFTRKWPVGTIPGGMERHACTLHMALARRGHQVHIFTSPPHPKDKKDLSKSLPMSPIIHFHEGEPGGWHYNKAIEQYMKESEHKPFDVVHSESVALPHYVAKKFPNLAVSWHGIALESMQSSIYQDLIRKPNEPMSPPFNKSIHTVIHTVLNEIRFFKSYQHHVAISDSCGELLRDVYQIPSKRVHVIVNGVDENDFKQNFKLGYEFRTKRGVPKDASLVLGVAGRLVKDKGHQLFYEAFSNLKQKYLNVYLVVVGVGPWKQRYKELGHQAIVVGSLSPSELTGFYNAIDIFVSPTLRPQGLDLTLMEAMMTGKPVMASRFPSIKGTIVVNDEFGFMFSPNVDSLSEALELVIAEGSSKLAQRGKACREYAVSMFTASKMALAYERLFLCMKNDKFCKFP